MPERVTSAETTSRGLTVPSALSSSLFKAESSLWQFTPSSFSLPLPSLWSSGVAGPILLSQGRQCQRMSESSQSQSPPSAHTQTHLFFPLSSFKFSLSSDAQVPSTLHDWPSLTSGNHRDPTGKRWRVKKTSETCTLKLSVS